MKILYGASKRYGAALQLDYFLSKTSHEIKVASYYEMSQSISHIDWLLDAVYTTNRRDLSDVEDIFGYKGIPLVRLDNITKFIDDVIAWEPDLFISDGEPITAHIAKLLNIDLIYSSSIYLLDGIVWHRGQFRYLNLLEKVSSSIKGHPRGISKLIVSPFGVLAKQPRLKNKYFRWVVPYYQPLSLVHNAEGVLIVMPDIERQEKVAKILKGIGVKFDVSHPLDKDYASKLSSSEFCLTSGEANVVSDAIFSGKKLLVAPNRNDPEELLNALLCEINGIGKNLGQIELAEKSALTIVEKAFEWNFRTDHLPLRKGKFLHERIEECLT